jgi:hypothetical protein
MPKPDRRNTIIGGHHRALARWYMILHRLKGVGAKNKHYAGRSLEMSKEEFIDWFRAKDFKGCSVDRIDNSKGYSLNNLQLIPLAQNIAKDKTAYNGITHVCSMCKEKKLAELFVRDKRRLSGIGSICKKCDTARTKNKGV